MADYDRVPGSSLTYGDLTWDDASHHFTINTANGPVSVPGQISRAHGGYVPDPKVLKKYGLDADKYAQDAQTLLKTAYFKDPHSLTNKVGKYGLAAMAAFAGGTALAGAGGAGAGGGLTTYPLATAPQASPLIFSGTGIPTAAQAAGAAAGAGGLGGAGLGGGAAVPAGGANLGGASLGYSPTAAGAPLGGGVSGGVEAASKGPNWRKIISQTMRQQADTPAQPNAATGGGGSLGRGLGGQSQWTPDRMRQIMGETVEQAALRRKRREIADAMVMQMATGGSGLGS